MVGTYLDEHGQTACVFDWSAPAVNTCSKCLSMTVRSWQYWSFNPYDQNDKYIYSVSMGTHQMPSRFMSHQPEQHIRS